MNSLKIITVLISIYLVSNVLCDHFITMEALGKPFRLGMLYDATTDAIIPGLSLWDNEQIEEATTTHPHESSFGEVKSIRSKKDKMDLLDVSAEVYIGITSGVTSIEITGKAAYINSEKSSSNEKSIAVSFTTYSHFNQLSQRILRESDFTYKDNTETDLATHVVTGILYGNGAILDFSLEASTSSDFQSIYGYLNVIVNAKNLVVDAEASLNLTNSESIDSSDISVDFYADFIPEKNPATYDEAIYLLQHMKDTLQNSASVPLMVYLQPLSAYSNNAMKYVKLTNYLSQNKYIEILEYLESALLTCSELKVSLHGKFPFTYNTVSSLESYIESYSIKIKASVANVLSTIKEGQSTSTSLEDIISNHNSSPFCKKCLKAIVSNLEILTNLLLTVTKKCVDILGDDVKYYETLAQSSHTTFTVLTINTFIANDWSSDMRSYMNDDNSIEDSFSYDDTKLQLFLSAVKGSISTVKTFLLDYVNNGDQHYFVREKQDENELIVFEVHSLNDNFETINFDYPQIPSVYSNYVNDDVYEVHIDSDDSDSSFDLFIGETNGKEIEWKHHSTQTSKIFVFDNPSASILDSFFKVSAAKNSFTSAYSNIIALYQCVGDGSDAIQYDNSPLCNYINECETNTANCPARSTCQDTRGAYQCNCWSGYKKQGGQCININECETNTANCPGYSTCQDTQGAYRCNCDSGYNKQGGQCININECETNTDNCPARSTCQDTQGAYRCNCWSGFKKQGGQCININECTTNTANCPARSTCKDTSGAYQCNCWSGYEKQGNTCININECTRNTANCPAHSTCEDTSGAYQCNCHVGYKKQGDQCITITCSRDDFENGQIAGGNIYGDTITYSCNTKYLLSGQTTRTCGSDGWSGTKPICEVITCSRDDIENGQIEGGNIIDDTITYSCNTNYRLIGQTTRTCGFDGWIGTKPTCEESYCEVTYRYHNGYRYENYACNDGTQNCKISGNKVKVGTSIKKTCIGSHRYMANSENAINKCEGHLKWQHTKLPFCYTYCAKLWENNNDKGDIWQIKESKYKDLTRSDNWDINNKNIDNDDIEQYQLWTGCNLKFWKNQSWKSHETSEMKWMYYSTKGNGKNWVPSGWGGKITAVQCWCN